MIERWIDELAGIWEFSDGRFGTVHSYRLIERAEFPDVIDASTLDTQPVALNYPASFKSKYSEGGPHIGFWTGVTEFHVAPDLDRKRLPVLLTWYRAILNAATSHMQLNGTVELFMLDDREDQIEGPMPLQYGDEASHWGFIVHWTVKERLEGQLTVSR